MNHYFSGRRRAHQSGFRGRTSRTQYFEARPARSIPSAFGLEIATKSLDQIKTSTNPGEAEISDCRFVASYNLLEGLQKTIFVPGRPPVWTPLPGATVLSPDSGDYYRDENAARFPEYPMGPAVKSIFQINPSFNPSKVDVFGCGSTLGHILNFAMGTPQPFSFTVHVIGKTAFFLRRNHSPTELIDNVHGYGHAFPEAYTTWSQDVKGSASHQRIIKYSFGGLQFLVRSEADGYILDQADDSEVEEHVYRSRLGKAGKSSATTTDALVEELLEHIIKPKSSSVKDAGDSLVVGARGRSTPQSSVFDLKTRSSRKQRDDIMAEQLPRLWIRQIHKFVLAFHTSGRFDAPDVLDVTQEMHDWEQRSENALSRMATLVKYIRDTAMAAEGGKLEIRGGESSTLHIHRLPAEEMGRWNALPHDLQKQWARE